MTINPQNVGAQIASLRKAKQLTQSALGERLNISFQAVSKWERGEALPDTSILMDLADALETTVDHILSGGEKMLDFKGRLAARDMREGVDCLERVGLLLGKQNILYRHAIDGIGERINADIDAMLSDDYLRECLILEAMLHNMKMGYYFEATDTKSAFRHERWYRLFCEYAGKYGMPSC